MHTIAQSAAIIRYISRIAEPGLLYPTDPIKAAIVDGFVDQNVDLVMGISMVRIPKRFGFGSVSAEQHSLAKKDLNDRVLPTQLGYFESLLAKSISGWLADTSTPSIADFVLGQRLQYFKTGKGLHIQQRHCLIMCIRTN